MKDKIEVMISKEEIDKRIEEVAEQIKKDYEGKTIYAVCVLKGGVIFLSDMVRKLDPLDININFMKTSSYNSGTVSSGSMQIHLDLDEDIKGKDVIIFEDIIDSGNTLSVLRKMLLRREPNTLRICTFLSKPSRREVEIPVDYTCFEIPDKFVVGYGLDYAQKYRNLPYLGYVCVE